MYKLRYLPLFYKDLLEIVTYISDELKNSQAAYDLVCEVENSILKRLDSPTSHEIFCSTKERKN